MKKLLALLLTLMLLTSAALAQEGLILTATVEACETLALKAPASGELSPFTLRAGDTPAAGDVLFGVEPIRVYADVEGTVASVYAQAGGSADAAVSRYGAVMQVEYLARTELHANAATGYKSDENRDLRVGMQVYLRSNNEKHFANGRITAVSGGNFTVEILDGDLPFTHTIKIFRTDEYTDKVLLGRTSISAVAPRAYSASGTVVEVAVQPGDAVKPGDYLFSYVPDAAVVSTQVAAEEDLIITAVNVQPGASVQKGQTLALCIRPGQYELSAQVEECDVRTLSVGDVFTVRFEESGAPSAQARVSFISPLGTVSGDISLYTVRFTFDAPDGVWPGMHAVLQK